MSTADVIPGRLVISIVTEFRLHAPATPAHAMTYIYSANYFEVLWLKGHYEVRSFRGVVIGESDLL